MNTDAPAAPVNLTELEALLNPALREATLAVVELAQYVRGLSEATLPAFRAAMAEWPRPAANDVTVERRLITGPEGSDLPVFIVNARPGASRPAILHMHGGGFVGGSGQYDLANLQDLARSLDCVCVSVDYRLAPETLWHGSLQDNYTGLRWLHANAAELGADPGRIAVMGESAGGGHAALLAIEARDRGEVPIVLQLLTYPMLDDRTTGTCSAQRHSGTLFWPAEANVYAWGAFLGLDTGASDIPAGAVPARVQNLAGLPAAFIGVGTLDLFVDEDIEYAQRLIAAGVATELHVVPGAVHGFDEIWPRPELVTQFWTLKRNALRRAFGLPVE